MEIINSLASLRKQKKISQLQLAKEVGVSVRTLYKWETGLEFPSIDKVYKISLILDTKVHDIFWLKSS